MPTTRARTVLVIVAATCVVLAVAFGRIERTTSSAPSGSRPAPRATETASPSDPRPAPAPDPDTIEHTRLARGETLDRVLERFGLDAPRRARWIAAIAEQVDPRRLRPGTGLTVTRAPDGRVRRIALRAEPDRYLRVGGVEEGTPAGEWIDVPVGIRVRTACGVIETSVARALADEPHAIELVAAFADIFQWDVDLFVDPRPGDVVRIVYESRVLAALPVDAPGFADLPDEPGAVLGIGRILAAAYDGSVARSRAYWVADDGGNGDYYDADGTPLRKAFLRSPLSYRRISSGFSRGRMHPVLRKVVPHHGVDFAADAGTPVASAADGRVVSAGWDGALGKAVRVRHGNGYVTVYGHLRAFARGIRRGATVEQDQIVGYVGSTGRATGPHLHYAMLLNGRPIDPLRFDNPPVEPLPDDRRPALARSVSLWTPILRSVVPPRLALAAPAAAGS